MKRADELIQLRNRWDELRTELREDIMKARINGDGKRYSELKIMYQNFFDF